MDGILRVDFSLGFSRSFRAVCSLTPYLYRVPCVRRQLKVLNLLEPVKEANPDVSYADLIVLAGSVALGEGATIPSLSFCQGRVDAEEDDPNHDLLSILEPIREYDSVIVGVRDRMKIAGLTVPQMVALAGRPRSTSHMVDNLGYSGSYTEDDGGARARAVCPLIHASLEYVTRRLHISIQHRIKQESDLNAPNSARFDKRQRFFCSSAVVRSGVGVHTTSNSPTLDRHAV